MSTQFVKNISISSYSDLGVMAIKRYSALSKAPALLDLAIKLFTVISRILIGVGVYPSAKVQSVYPTVSANWACKI